jgi:hypothetical protein
MSNYYVGSNLAKIGGKRKKEMKNQSEALSSSSDKIPISKMLRDCFRSNFWDPKNFPNSHCSIPCCGCYGATIQAPK